MDKIIELYNPKNSAVDSAYLYLSNARKACSSFFELFNSIRKTRKARGTPNDTEQDLLRAMLIFSASGLDSTLKELIKKSLKPVIKNDEGAKDVFQTWISKNIYRNENLDSEMLVKALVADSSLDALISILIDKLTANSLQSAEEIFKVGALFNIPTKDLTSDNQKLKDIFKVRNEIAHELDIDLTLRNRSRFQRRKGIMLDYTNDIFRVSNNFIKEVDKKISAT